MFRSILFMCEALMEDWLAYKYYVKWVSSINKAFIIIIIIIIIIKIPSGFEVPCSPPYKVYYCTVGYNKPVSITYGSLVTISLGSSDYF